jgi:hypothetical protein
VPPEQPSPWPIDLDHGLPQNHKLIEKESVSNTEQTVRAFGDCYLVFDAGLRGAGERNVS